MAPGKAVRSTTLCRQCELTHLEDFHDQLGLRVRDFPDRSESYGANSNEARHLLPHGMTPWCRSRWGTVRG